MTTSSNPADRPSVPAIRFKGFTDAWEQRCLHDLASRMVRKNENNLVRRPLTISAQDGLVDQMEYFSTRIAPDDTANYFVVHRGDFAYNRSSAEGKPYGSIKRLDRYENGVVSTLYTVFRPVDDHLRRYLAWYFDGASWHREICRLVSEGARSHGLLNISPTDFLAISVKKPRQAEEMLALDAIFGHLDRLIALHQRKVEMLQRLKKSLLEQMFPSEGEDVPRLRFKGFTYAWEQRRLGYWFQERTERRADLPLLSVSQTFGVVLADSLAREMHPSEDRSNYKHVAPGDITYNTMRMWQGASGSSQLDGIVSPAYTVITPLRERAYSPYFAWSFKADSSLTTFRRRSQGLTSDTWNLKYDLLQDIEFKAPFDVTEQRKISALLKAMSVLIALHQRKVEMLQNLKKSLLEKMFV